MMTKKYLNEIFFYLFAYSNVCKNGIILIIFGKNDNLDIIKFEVLK